MTISPPRPNRKVSTGSLPIKTLGGPDLLGAERGQDECREQRHEADTQHEQEDRRGQDRDSGSDVGLEASDRSADGRGRILSDGRIERPNIALDRRGGIDVQRASDDDDGLQSRALEDRLTVEDDERPDVTLDRRGPTRDDDGIGCLAVRDGDVAVEGHQHAVGAIESRRFRQDGGRGDP